MSQIGIPGLSIFRRTIRAQVNPMDKCTIASIYPRRIFETKITITPSQYELLPGTVDNPSVLIVGSASWWREIDEKQPLLEIPNSSIQVAESIVRDYCNGLLGCTMNVAMPGIFWVPGELTSEQLVVKHKGLVTKAANQQRLYYTSLVKMADSLWARTNGNPLVISDDMRLAARELNLNNKDWMKDFATMNQVRCSACGSLRNPEYPVCPTCKAVVDVELAKKLDLKFVQ